MSSFRSRRHAVRALLVTGAATGLALAYGAAPSQAAGTATTVAKSADGRTVLVTAAAGQVNAITTFSGSNGSVPVISVTDTKGVTPGSGCTAFSSTLVYCPAAGVTFLDIRAGDGNDTVTQTANVDSISYGQDGQDVLSASGTKRDAMSGGPGVDSVTYANQTGAVYASLNTAIDDGPANQTTRDFIGADVERLVGGRGNDLLNTDRSGVTIDGGPGDDVISGSSAGSQTFIGGPGKDRVAGNGGADLFSLIDGAADTFSCGTDAAGKAAGSAFVDGGLDRMNAPYCSSLQFG